jgi:hypothetical protein
VEGWNNQGLSTGNATYGSICYDTIAPVTTAARGIETAKGTVLVTLKASDAGASSRPATGSGVAYTYFSVNNTACTVTAPSKCAIYRAPFYLSGIGTHTVRYFSEDKAGNFEEEKKLVVTITAR